MRIFSFELEVKGEAEVALEFCGILIIVHVSDLSDALGDVCNAASLVIFNRTIPHDPIHLIIVDVLEYPPFCWKEHFVDHVRALRMEARSFDNLS